MMKKNIPPLWSAVAFAIQLSACGSGDTAGKAPGGAGQSATPEMYSVLTLTPHSVAAHADFPATIQGVQVIEVRPMISGYIGSINVQEGSTVRKGQLLFTIINPQYEQDVLSEEAAIKSAEANAATAEMNVRKAKPLVDEDIISKYQLESAEHTLDANKAVLAQAQAALANAKVNLGYTKVYSPLDGVIATIPYKVGALVSSTSTDPLTKLSDISQVYAYFSLDEKQLLQLLGDKPGISIQEKLDHSPDANLVLADGSVYPLKGKLKTASGMVTTSTGSTSFKALFPNPNRLIRSGASAIVRVPRNYDSAILIPQSATSEIQNKRLVYVVRAGNMIHAVAIATTTTDDGKFFVVNSGLSAGDQIVLNGITSLRDSLVIRPAPVNADSIYRGLQR